MIINKNMKKIIIIITIFILNSFNIQSVSSATITGGISISDYIPEGFFGSWHVTAVRERTTNERMFVAYSTEIWNLSKDKDVITLENPVSGASASITIKDVTGKTFTFQRITGDKNETVTETATLTLSDDSFFGCDSMIVRTYQNGTLIKTENVKYNLKARKISGSNIKNIFSVK